MSNVTRIKRQPEDLLERPINVLDDRLAQAHAMVDLLYTLASADNNGGEHIESLCTGTLIQSLHGVMLHIEEAQEATTRLAGPVSWAT
jgi:hypothetical protein